MPIAGFTRFRKHQVGLQSVVGTLVPATRILPYRGSIDFDPQRTDPDVDVGSLDPILAPFAGAAEVTGTWEGKEAFDDAPYLWALAVMGGVTPTGGGSAKTWVWEANSLTADPIAIVSDEWGDDMAGDVKTGVGGTINTLELSFGDDLSAFDVNAELIYADAELCDDFTGALTIDNSPNWVYGADTEVFLDTTPGAIGTTKLVDAVHGATFRLNNNLDQKRFANGSNSRFNLVGYGRGPREIEVELVLAKTAASVAESCTLDDTPVPNRYIEIRTTSPEIITGSTPYSQAIRVPARLISRSEGEIGGNTTMTLTYRGFYDSTLTYPLWVKVVNELTAL